VKFPTRILEVLEVLQCRTYRSLTHGQKEQVHIEFLTVQQSIKRSEALQLFEDSINFNMETLQKILAPQLVTAENVAEIFQLTTNTTKLPSVKDYCVEFFSKFELTAAVEKSAFQRLPKLLQDSLMSAGNAKYMEQVNAKKETQDEELDMFWQETEDYDLEDMDYSEGEEEDLDYSNEEDLEES